MCRHFEVSRQGYAAWRRRQAAGPGVRQRCDEELLEAIVAIYTASHGRYGAPRVYAQLRRDGWRVGHNRVAALMAANALAGRPGRPPSVRTTVAERDFTPEAPDRTWVTDITYIHSAQGFLFLAAIIDCYSRMVVGWAVADHLRTELCLDALGDAVGRRRPEPGLIHHSDYAEDCVKPRNRDVGVCRRGSLAGSSA